MTGGRNAVIAALLLASACAPRATPVADPRPAIEPGLARQVEVIRTEYGVPHIYADTLRALGYALGYLQVEDYGDRVPLGLLGARGERARYEGPGALDTDFANRPAYLRAVETYRLLTQDTRDVYEGFAAGVNRYVERHPGEFPGWMRPEFTGYDVAALYVYQPGARLVREWTQRLREADRPLLLDLDDPIALPEPRPADAPLDEDGHIEEGSSAWALAPSRSSSNAAILLRNPHLAWTAGYWEAHVVVPGRLDFYGDFRIGGPLGIIGGFNRHLAFATTNNEVNSAEVYALEVDPQRPDHYRFDDASWPIRRERFTRPFRDGSGHSLATRERLLTHVGPVLHRDDTWIYVIRAAEDGEFRGGEQFLRLMQATSLAEWTDAMRLRAHPRSNFVYADAAGNILYLWNAAIPVRPHPSGGGMLAVPATRTAEIWTAIHELDALPQLLNPPGGYLRNENDGPWLVNLRQPLDPAAYPAYFEGNGFGLRSQHSTRLLDNNDRFSLEDIVRLKHTYRMLLADRVKDDLIAASRAAPEGVLLAGAGSEDRADTAAALALLERWDNTAAPASRGAVLFAEWWRLYQQALGDGSDEAAGPFAVAWASDAPTDTPRGLADPQLAARLLPVAMREVAEQFGSWDVAWGDVHRVRRGDVDEPVGGCPGALGCLRVLNFQTAADGRRVVSGGDGWVLAVELTDPPRAYSVLGYGQSAREDSPHHADQAALFARGGMKPVAYTREDVERRAVRRYRPGLE